MPGLIQPERVVTWLTPHHALVAVKSLFTGKVHSWALGINRTDWDAWQAGKHIQNAMPYLTADEREFLLSGATPDEWAAMRPEDDIITRDDQGVPTCNFCGRVGQLFGTEYMIEHAVECAAPVWEEDDDQ